MEKFFRIFLVDENGAEHIDRPCMREVAARPYVTTYNQLSARNGVRLVARELDINSARLSSNSQCQF